MNKIILFFVILAIGVGIVGFWYYQKNFYSKECIKLEILSQENADLLEEIEYIVKYKNNGNIRVEEPELIFEYPEHSIVIDEKPLRQNFGVEDLGEAIYPGEERTFKFKARLLGKEGEAKIAKAWLSYRPKNLKARYESATTFTTIINKIPLTFEFDMPSKIESEKEIKFRINYFSIAEYPLSDLRIKIQYPDNFEFIQSTPEAIEKIEWDINVLNKASGGRIEITGKLFGEIGEQKIFHAELGTWRKGEFILLKQAFQGVEIIKPSLFISQQINGNPEYVANAGDQLHYEIFFKNVGEKALTNLFLVSKLEGRPFDFTSIKAPIGDFEPGDNSIVFDWQKIPELQFLDAQQEGKIEFWIKLKDEWDIRGLEDKNPILKNKIYLSQWQEFTTKVNTKLAIEQKAYFEEETAAYTIIWNVKNYYNSVENVKVKAILPSNVELTGKISPEEQTEKFAFDSESREIVWEIGNMEMGQGVLDTLISPNIAFQIKLCPDESREGEPIEIIKEARITGNDTWTEQIVFAISPGIDTASLGGESGESVEREQETVE